VGYTAGEFISGRVLYEQIIHPEDLKKVYKLVTEMSLNATADRFEHEPYRLKTKAGRDIWVSDKTDIIRNAQGEITHYQGVIEDITQKKQMQEQLILADRLSSVGELASGIAHELNNPLTGIIGIAELLLNQKIPDHCRQDLELMHSEAQRAAQVVRNLLTFARKHSTDKKAVDINEVIKRVMELRTYEQRVSNIDVVYNLAVGLPKTSADFFQMQQCFLNIVINAEFSMIDAHNGGRLVITTESVGDIVRTSIADNGPGIPEENLGHIFDPFFTTKDVGKGTGLGLSICHGIITEQGGSIHAESELGKGATFIVDLPVAENDNRQAEND
jgi:PAS domain S-box-containing protein